MPTTERMSVWRFVGPYAMASHRFAAAGSPISPSQSNFTVNTAVQVQGVKERIYAV
jgi:hypothetical protein